MSKREYNRSPNASRPYTTHSFRSEIGKSRCSINCPFCGTTSTAYLWSIRGGGKICENRKECGAKFDAWGNAFPVVGREHMQPSDRRATGIIT